MQVARAYATGFAIATHIKSAYWTIGLSERGAQAHSKTLYKDNILHFCIT